MTLVTRDDIEPFPPVLHRNVVYVRNADNFKPFVLAKLINAEYSAYRCRTFSLLQERTRCSYLKTLCENLTEKTYEALCDEVKRASHRRLSLLSNSNKKRYFSNVKKMFTRSNSTPDGPHGSIKSEQSSSDKVRPRHLALFRPVFAHWLFLGKTKEQQEKLALRKIGGFRWEPTFVHRYVVTWVWARCWEISVLTIFDFLATNWFGKTTWTIGESFPLLWSVWQMTVRVFV